MRIYVAALDSVECSVMCVVLATIYFRDMCIIHIIQVLLSVACHMHLNCNKVLAHTVDTHTHARTHTHTHTHTHTCMHLSPVHTVLVYAGMYT